MVKLHSAETFIKDPVDVWGKEQTIGLAELAVRTHAPPMVFDRRGDVVYWDDFESASLKYKSNLLGGSGTIARSTSYTMFGDFCAKLTTEATTGKASQISYRISNYHDGKIGVQVGFATQSTDAIIYLRADHYDGATQYISQLKYETSNYHLSYYGDDGLWHLIDTIKILSSVSYKPAYNILKMVIDLSTLKYHRSLCLMEEDDLSSYDLYSSALVRSRQMEISLKVEAAANAIQTVYFDNFIITENEPV